MDPFPGNGKSSLDFKPGLVGGHCIGVDPYYLTYKAERMGYIPQIILSGRRINDGMGEFIAQQTIKEMIHAGIQILGSTVTILGLTFKENCPDLRNSKVKDIVKELKEFGIKVQISDCYARNEDIIAEYNLEQTPIEDLRKTDSLIFAVAHDMYIKDQRKLVENLLSPNSVIIDVKNIIMIQLFMIINKEYGGSSKVY